MSQNSSRIEQLIAAARAGDPAARDELFRSCRNYVSILARTQVESWMRAKVDASDLVQQTMLEAHRGFDQFSGQDEGEWLAWLKRILVHNTSDFIRRFRTAKRAAGKEVDIERSTAESGAWGMQQLAGELPTPSQVLMAHERELALADALSKLSPDHQEVLHLRSLQRLPFEEVADRMQRSRPAVQMLWMRALEKLERVLNDAESA